MNSVLFPGYTIGHALFHQLQIGIPVGGYDRALSIREEEGDSEAPNMHAWQLHDYWSRCEGGRLFATIQAQGRTPGPRGG
eukprot:CAMPEP_0185207380 /NCGR_PEP_ID=MMETSP1140-20130426/60153_1 /TAXON_ID=298111 /ORGANISM="Pavlova sp., Strain CCMP459" /LENGTH=79 /DNA_ID=CAMNT_0027775065 /DNA_START=170 /DNA_END=406 /DNA_ORIENTATION=-